MGEKQDQLKVVLDDLLDEDGITGSAIVSSDGIPVLSRYTRSLDEMPFSLLVQGAMTATLMGAAEVAMQEVAAGQPNRVIVETDALKMVLLTVDDDLILVTLAEAELPLARLLPPMGKAVERVREIVGE